MPPRSSSVGYIQQGHSKRTPEAPSPFVGKLLDPLMRDPEKLPSISNAEPDLLHQLLDRRLRGLLGSRRINFETLASDLSASQCAPSIRWQFYIVHKLGLRGFDVIIQNKRKGFSDPSSSFRNRARPALTARRPCASWARPTCVRAGRTRPPGSMRPRVTRTRRASAVGSARTTRRCRWQASPRRGS